MLVNIFGKNVQDMFQGRMQTNLCKKKVSQPEYKERELK